MLPKRSFLNSFKYAIRGLAYAIRSERSMQIHLVVALIVLFLAILFKFTKIEWMILFIIIFMVTITETVNTAIEINVDLVTKKQRPRAMMAKDVAAGAVFLSAVGAIILGLFLFANKI